ncbi:GtrA family protein [Enterovibrio makurazakiensis]|uniref:GtrA family protein n=1 Tax=Enterovibrio makurazakiensis TaxID=2910232 RepID=UPI003D225B12
MRIDIDKCFSSFNELIRYALVGIFQNSLGYLIYIALTYIGIDHKVVVAISYPLGLYVSYRGNSTYTFNGFERKGTVVRFFIVHLMAYTLNLFFLYYFSDVLGYPHQVVQLFCIAIIAIYLFIMLKIYVFKNTVSEG